MRMRMVHPAFWQDKRMGRLPAQAVLVYVGLWMLSDDSGWSRFDAEEMAVQLFPYKDHRTRTRMFNLAVKQLVEAGRLQLHQCGHAFVPKLAIYQTWGRPKYDIREEHRRCPVIGEDKVRIGEDKVRIDARDSTVQYGTVQNVPDKSTLREDTFDVRERPREGLKAKFGDYHEMLENQRRRN